MRESLAALKAERSRAARPSWREVEAERDELAGALPNLPDPGRARRDDRGGRGRPARGRRPPPSFDFEPLRPPRARASATAGSTWRPPPRPPARASPTSRRPRHARAGAGPLRAGAAPRRGLRARWSRRCWSASRRCTAPASSPASASTDLRGPERRALPRRHLRGLARRAARRRDPRGRASCRCATRASRPASAARPAPPGRDTRGIFRVHQFDKVEMFSFVEPRRSGAEHERLLAIEERILGALEIPYRVVNIAASATSAPRPRRSSTARPGSRARSATAR